MVIHLRFFAELPQVEIARRMGVSQMQISRLQQRAIVKIRQALQAP
jgi:RNA polymerase sigma factor (sigma-70 family)